MTSGAVGEDLPVESHNVCLVTVANAINELCSVSILVYHFLKLVC